MGMFIKNKPGKEYIKRNVSYEGETIETKVFRIKNNGEPIADGAPLIYTDRKDGVKPEYDIRTDKMEILCGTMSKISEGHRAKREEKYKAPVVDIETGKKDGGTESVQVQGGTTE